MRPSRGAFTALACLILTSFGFGGNEVPAVLLYRTPPHAPLEAAGTGLAPQVTVRLHIDARGKPSTVEIVRISPSSAYDFAFSREVRDALSTWRAAPQLRDGVAIPSVIEWTIEFSAIERESEEGWRKVRGPSSLGPPRDRQDRWIEHLARISQEERQRLRQVARLSGERLLTTEGRQQALSDHFEVITDGPTERTAEVVAGNLEGTYGAAYRIFAGKIPPEIAAERVLVFLFRSEGSFRSFASSRQVSLENAAGFYDSLGLLAFHLEMGASEILRGVLLHEGVHAFLNQHVVRPGVRLPLWLDEGLATYVENSEVRDGQIVLGSLKSRIVYHNPVAPIRARSLPRVTADEVKKAFRKGRAIPLNQLLAARGEEFYGEKARLFYTQAWMFVHFLRHGRSGWAESEFPKFVLYVAEGFAPGDVFRSVYGGTPEGLSKEFGDYIAKF